ncbi:MAG: radical SAM protein [Lentisphaeria bacterium]|nr:radical SAM protein [Lentisphaeria bacterium]NQZ66817.1 radical SAM protein [Lentisphaeria bacterium]
MLHKTDDDWLLTPNGDPRGYIQSDTLDELWFHTGTNCNLSCPFCLEGSKPGDNRIEMLHFDEAKPFIDEALELGVKTFSFTGGEPFINPEFVEILSYALEHRPCQVLTNATEPLMNNFAGVRSLLSKANDVNFRVSLDHPDPEKHDESRGRGNFKKALKTLGRLHQEGFTVSIARLMLTDEDSVAVDKSYETFFEEAGIPLTINIIKFPDFHAPGTIPEVPHITESCMTKYLSEEQRNAFMCKYSRMIVKKSGRLGVYACTLVDDDPDYDFGNTLKESMSVEIKLRHHRCYSCFAFGASCSEA